MSDYRLGHYLQAIEWADTATNNLIADSEAKAKAFAVLAMAEWQLGQKNAARAALTGGDALAPRISSESGPVDLGESWVAWLMARITLDEADALIDSASLAASKSSSR